MGLRHGNLGHAGAAASPHLTDVGADRAFGDIGSELGTQALPDAAGRVALLAGRGAVGRQPGIDLRFPGTQPRSDAVRHFARRRDGAGQRLAHGAAMDVMPLCQGANREPFQACIAPDLLELLHPRHPVPPSGVAAVPQPVRAIVSWVELDQPIKRLPGGAAST
jgi:hypothetical protein